MFALFCANFWLERVPNVLKFLYSNLGKTYDKIETDVASFIQNSQYPFKIQLDEFVGSLSLDHSFIRKKLHAFNRHILNIEFGVYCLKSDPQRLLNQLPNLVRVLIDPRFKQAQEQEDLESVQAEYLNLYLEDLGFLTTLVQHKGVSEIKVLDSIFEVISQYRVPIVFEKFFSEFVPSVIRQ